MVFLGGFTGALFGGIFWNLIPKDAGTGHLVAPVAVFCECCRIVHLIPGIVILVYIFGTIMIKSDATHNTNERKNIRMRRLQKASL